MYIIRISQIWEHYFQITTSLNVNFAAKLEQIIDPVIQLFNYTDGFSFNSFLIIVVSLLQGIVVTLLFYIKIFKQREIQQIATCKIGADTSISSGIGAFISFFGVGCVPCKTALISPVISLIFTAGGPIAFATALIMDAILMISILLSVYAICKMLYLICEVYYPAEVELMNQKQRGKK